jgi:2-aminoethylphosphonate-pyruvate transaminase
MKVVTSPSVVYAQSKLMNPGPVTLTERVRRSLQRPDVCHREPEFADLTKRVMTRISAIYPESQQNYTPVLLTSSGTGAVETMLSLVPGPLQSGKPVLVVANGVYGERAAAMLTAQGKPHELLKGNWTSGLDLGQIENALLEGKYGHVFAVHHETTTGRLNDVAGLGALCIKHKTPMLLDAVSSFAGEKLEFDAWNLEACAATANKCVHGVPGIAFVVAKTEVLETRATGATSVYLDLFRYYKEQKSGFSPFTQSVHAMFGLDEALAELHESGGWATRHAQYAEYSAILREGLAKINVRTFLEEESVYGSTLVSYHLPKAKSYAALHDVMKAAGFTIYAGQGAFAGQMFRLAVMGDLSKDDIKRALSVLSAELAS